MSKFEENLKKSGWWGHLDSFFSSDKWHEMSNDLREMYKTGGVFPEPQNIFRVFSATHFNDIKVVILGQDPYPTRGIANGFAFATNTGNPAPAPLRGIIREVEEEYNWISDPSKVTLDAWMKQGVMLLSTSFTVEESRPGSHVGKWKDFGDMAIKALSDDLSPKVFMLWGNYVKSKRELINPDRHLILEAAYPTSHLFKGNGHFRKANRFLDKPIDWTAIDLVDLTESTVNLPEWTDKDEYYERVSRCKT